MSFSGQFASWLPHQGRRPRPLPNGARPNRQRQKGACSSGCWRVPPTGPATEALPAIAVEFEAAFQARDAAFHLGQIARLAASRARRVASIFAARGSIFAPRNVRRRHRHKNSAGAELRSRELVAGYQTVKLKCGKTCRRTAYAHNGAFCGPADRRVSPPKRPPWGAASDDDGHRSNLGSRTGV
jgi:hypothetical protein